MTTPPFRRDAATLACYVLLALLTSSFGMLGPLIPWLRDALSLSYQQAAYHTAAMAIGVVVTGMIVPSVAARLGRRGCLAYSFCALSGALALIGSAGSLPVSLFGGFVLGSALPFTVTVASAVMAERHGARTGIAMAEANAIAYIGFLLAPVIVSVAASTAGWRWSFLPPALMYIAFWLTIRHIDFGVVRLKMEGTGHVRLPAAFWCHWLMLGLSISAELSMVVWGPSYLETVLGLKREMALWASMIFPAGMLVGRLLVAMLLRRYRSEQLVLVAMFAGALGVMLFVLADGLAVAVVGLFVAGFGMAGLYPFGITLAMQSAGAAPDRAAARASLASGFATLMAPLLIGVLADKAGLHAAFSLVPMFLVLATGAHFVGRRMAR